MALETLTRRQRLLLLTVQGPEQAKHERRGRAVARFIVGAGVAWGLMQVIGMEWLVGTCLAHAVATFLGWPERDDGPL